MGVMRMRADRAAHVGITLGNRQHLGVAAHAGRNGDHEPDALGTGAGNDGVELRAEVREIEVTVAVDEHGIVSSWRGPHRLRRIWETRLSALEAWCRPRCDARRRGPQSRA